VPGLLGAAVLADGRPVLVLNGATCARVGLTRRPARRRDASPEAPAPAARVLLAEDTTTTRVLERMILEGAGYRVEAVADGAAAWQALNQAGADLVVSDVDMPVMDGFELCAAIRRSPRFADLPVVLVTSLATDEDRARGVDVGADAYIVKADFEQRALLEAIGRLL
jgi:two-component system chemotaxis sensor kinase CheA